MKKTTTLLFFLFLGSWLFAQIQSQQIGSAGNAYSTYFSGAHSLSFLPGTGTNGGSLSFVHRENPAIHTGGTTGSIRFSVSKDGGQTWRLEQGPATPLLSRLSRYPQCLLFNPDSANTDTNNVEMLVVNPTLNATGAGFDGHVHILVDSVLTLDSRVVQEDYLYQIGQTDPSARLPKSLVERVPNEFWYVTDGTNARTPTLYKGVYNPGTNQISWQTPSILPLAYRAAALQAQGIQLAFSPDGQIGYIAMVGDLTGGPDMTYNPVFMKSTDGGQTWGPGEEVDMRKWPDLVDTLNNVAGASGRPVIGSAFSGTVVPNVTDLTVDANGVPHFFVLVGNELSASFPNYQMSEEKLLVVDITQDTAGNWEGIYIGPKSTRRATIGDPSVVSGFLVFESWLQVTRNQTGTKIFYSWNDTDTSRAGWSIAQGNNAPDLFGRGWDVNSRLLTPIQNWTGNDTTWNGRILTPTVTNTVIQQGGNFKVPTMVMRLDSNTASLLNPVTYWYFSNIQYNNSQFQITPKLFRLFCGANPLVAQISGNDAVCGQRNGFVKVNISSNSPGPINYAWNNGATADSVGGLLAGTYSVVVTDDSACTQSLSISITDFPGPAINSLTSTDVSCNGGNDGSALVTAGGGSPPYQLSWVTGDTTFGVSNLQAGSYLFTLTDSLGCVADTSVLISEPSFINILVAETPTLCFGSSDGSAAAFASGGTPGFTYSWSNGDTGQNTSSTLSAGVYTVTVTDANMCSAEEQVTVTQPAALLLLPSPVDARCNGAIDGSISLNVTGGTPGYRYLWSNNVTIQNLVNVGAGTYTVTVTDANNCTSSISTVVNQPTPVTVSLTGMDISCFGQKDGSIQLTPGGGTPSYTFSWTNGATTQNLSNLSAGIYAVTVFDANNCTGSDVLRISEPPQISINLSSSPDNGTGNGQASAMVTGGNPPFTYSWNTGQSSATIKNLFSGNYILTVTDANNCRHIDTIMVGSNVSIDDLLASGIQNLKVYPNPTSGQFQIDMSLDHVQDAELQIMDLTGRVVWKHTARNAFYVRETVMLEHVARGTYLLRITTAKGSASMKIMIK